MEDIFPSSTFMDKVNDVDFDVMSKSNRYVLGASYNDEENIRIHISVIKDEFNLVELTAKHKDKPNRIAKSNEILFLIDPPSITNTEKEVIYNIEISPDLKGNKYSSRNIAWYYDKPGMQTGIPKDEGSKSITRNHIEDSNKINTTVKAGFPNITEKSVNIKWVDEDKKKFNVVPPGIQNTLKTVFNNMTKIKKITEKFGKYKLDLAPKIEFYGSEFNTEDDNSRFYIITRDGGVNASLDLKYKIPLPPPYSIDLTIPWIDYKIGEIGAYIDLVSSLKCGGVLRYERRSDK